MNVGAPGQTRTGTPFPATDFELAAMDNRAGGAAERHRPMHRIWWSQGGALYGLFCWRCPNCPTLVAVVSRCRMMQGGWHMVPAPEQRGRRSACLHPSL